MLQCSDITTLGDTNHWFALSIRKTENEIGSGAAREHCGNPLTRQAHGQLLTPIYRENCWFPSTIFSVTTVMRNYEMSSPELQPVHYRESSGVVSCIVPFWRGKRDPCFDFSCFYSPYLCRLCNWPLACYTDRMSINGKVALPVHAIKAHRGNRRKTVLVL
jgi:hypothetical protein